MKHSYSGGKKKSGHNIHPSSVKPGTGSGNLYKHLPKSPVVDKQKYHNKDVYK
jgi:hypothetical protein